MKALRRGFPWQGSGLLLGLLLWGLLPSPTASQDLATQLQALKTAVPDSQRRIASSVRTAAQMVSQNGMAAARAQMEPGLRLHSSGNARSLYLYLDTAPPLHLTPCVNMVSMCCAVMRSLGIVYATRAS